MEETKQRFCKKCLLQDISEEEYFRHIHSYVEGLDNELKASDDLYQKRLSKCKECDHLLNGMCRVCGCFVEMRAAMKKNYCPSIEKQW